MKKILAIIIAAVMIAACTVTAFAETTNVSYNVDPSYTVSIPAAVTLGDSAVEADITASDVIMEDGKQIKVELTSASNTASGSTFNAKNGDSTVTYTITGDEAIAVGDTVATFTADGSKTLTFSAADKSAATVAGSHTETLTFTVSVEDAGPTWKTVDLSALTGGYTAQDGDKLTGTLANNYKIMIANGATVKLDGVTINGGTSNEWAGLTCAGDATIILSGENTLKGFHENYPGLQAGPSGTSLTIKGDGSLNATGTNYAPAIGCVYTESCGNITIEGGTITAQANYLAAGIGTSAGGTCGDITITDGVTSVTATKGEYASSSIGAGYGGTCGTVTIAPGANVVQN